MPGLYCDAADVGIKVFRGRLLLHELGMFTQDSVRVGQEARMQEIRRETRAMISGPKLRRKKSPGICQVKAGWTRLAVRGR